MFCITPKLSFPRILQSFSRYRHDVWIPRIIISFPSGRAPLNVIQNRRRYSAAMLHVLLLLSRAEELKTALSFAVITPYWPGRWPGETVASSQYTSPVEEWLKGTNTVFLIVHNIQKAQTIPFCVDNYDSVLLAKLGWEEALPCYCKLAAIFEGRIYATLVSFSECDVSCQT